MEHHVSTVPLAHYVTMLNLMSQIDLLVWLLTLQDVILSTSCCHCLKMCYFALHFILVMNHGMWNVTCSLSSACSFWTTFWKQAGNAVSLVSVMQNKLRIRQPHLHALKAGRMLPYPNDRVILQRPFVLFIQVCIRWCNRIKCKVMYMYLQEPVQHQYSKTGFY